MERPLHVQVAEALGWTDLRPHEVLPNRWEGRLPGTKAGEWIRWRVPRYDVETEHMDYEDYEDGWAATGPLIEQYRIVTFLPHGSAIGEWNAQSPEHAKPSKLRCRTCQAQEYDVPFATGPTPLIAVCRLIVFLAAKGLLQPRAAA